MLRARLPAPLRSLNVLNESITRKTAIRTEHDKAIEDTEAAYLQIMETSQTLLGALPHAAASLWPVLRPARVLNRALSWTMRGILIPRALRQGRSSGSRAGRRRSTSRRVRRKGCF